MEPLTPSAGEAATRKSLHKACDTCKRRKVRCSGSVPCQHCSRSNATCTYTSAHGKLTLVRLLQETRKRNEVLEAAWRRCMPGIDPDVMVEPTGDHATPTGTDGYTVVVTGQAVSSKSLERSANALPMESLTSQPEPAVDLQSESELDLDTVEALEWDEASDVGTITDGIGSLAVAKTSGYMGPQSGTVLLRYIYSMGNFWSEEASWASPKPALDDSRSTPSSSFRDRCVDWYFKHFHSAYPLLHEGSFRAMLMGAIPKPKDGSWTILLNMVLAVGALTGPDSALGMDAYFFKIAHEASSIDLLHRGSIHLVQAFALMANYLQKRNKPNAGFTYLGVALNMALGLGLHREFSDKSISPFAMETRRRLWWTLFIFDSGARLTFGRPSMTLHGANTRSPINLNDSDISIDADQLGEPSTHPTTTSSLIWQCKLAEISNDANAKLLERRLPDYNDMILLDNRVISWFEALPSYFIDPLEPDFQWFDIPRMVLRWRAMHLQIVIMRPFLLDAIKNRRDLNMRENGPIYQCTQAAQACIRSIVDFCSVQEVYPGALVWYVTYWLVTAVLVSITCLVFDPYHASAALWRVQIQESKQILESMASMEPIADRAVFILNRILELVPDSPGLMTIDANEQLRMNIADVWSESWQYDESQINLESWRSQ